MCEITSLQEMRERYCGQWVLAGLLSRDFALLMNFTNLESRSPTKGPIRGYWRALSPTEPPKKGLLCGNCPTGAYSPKDCRVPA